MNAQPHPLAIRSSVTALSVLALWASALAFAQGPALLHLRQLDFNGPPASRVEGVLRALELDRQSPELTSEQRRIAFGVLMTAAMQIAIEDAPVNRADRLLTIGPRMLSFQPSLEAFKVAEYDGEFDYFPIFMTLVAASQCQAEHFSLCRLYRELAASYLPAAFKNPALANEVSKGLSGLDEWLRSEDPLAEGVYVTNFGVVQNWIGKVQFRGATSLRVLVTYVREGASPPAPKGGVVEIAPGDVKPLGAVSIDALTHGFLE